MEGFRNEMKMEFLAISSNEGFARVAVGAFVSELDPTVDEYGGMSGIMEAIYNVSEVYAPPEENMESLPEEMTEIP